jgi:hypothetical protein
MNPGNARAVTYVVLSGCCPISVPGQAAVFSRDHEHLALGLRIGHVRSPQPCFLCALQPMLCLCRACSLSFK